MWFSAVEIPEGDDVVVSVTGDLDLASVAKFRRALRSVAPPTSGNVIVDLAGVDVLDSTGIGLLVGARRRVVEAGGSFTVRCGSGRVADLLRASGVAELLALEVH
jgi:anti-sigma B factor antagonist